MTGMTSVAQPLDTGLMRPLQVSMKATVAKHFAADVLSATEAEPFKLSTTLASNRSLIPLWVEETMISIMSKQSLWDNVWKHFNCKRPEQHLAAAMKAMSAGTSFRAGKFGGKTIETAGKLDDVDVDTDVASGDENLLEEVSDVEVEESASASAQSSTTPQHLQHLQQPQVQPDGSKP
eukprot:6454866-Amphidinium_carterae.2